MFVSRRYHLRCLQQMAGSYDAAQKVFHASVRQHRTDNLLLKADLAAAREELNILRAENAKLQLESLIRCQGVPLIHDQKPLRYDNVVPIADAAALAAALGGRLIDPSPNARPDTEPPSVA